MLLDTLLDVNNNGNKVLIHYNPTGTQNQVLDFIVDKDQLLEVSKEDGQIELIPAKHAKKTRACLPLNLDDLLQKAETQFDLAAIKMGYAWLMPFDPVKGRQIKIAKKETELRQLFNLVDDKKVSFWSHEWDDINIDGLDTDQKKLSFIRGAFSAKATIRPGPAGYIAFNWEKLEKTEKEIEKHKNEYSDGSSDFLELFGYELFKSYPNIEYNGCNIFFATRDQIGEYLKCVGFVQKSKMEVALASYRLHLRVINNVIPLDNDYLLYHVQNFSRAEDYDPHLLEYYNIDAQDPKTGRTPLINSIKSAKYRSLYPARWLIDNGANINISSYSGESFEEIFYAEITKDDVMRDGYYTCDGFVEFCLLILDKISSNAIQYTNNFFKMIGKNSGYYSVHKFDKVYDNVVLAKLDKTCILISLLNNITTDYHVATESFISFLSIIVNYSAENLQEIFDNILNKILAVIEQESSKRVKYNRWNKDCCDIFHGCTYLIVLFDHLFDKVQPDFTKIQKIQMEIDRLNLSVRRPDFISHSLLIDRKQPLKFLLQSPCNKRCVKFEYDRGFSEYKKHLKYLNQLLNKNTENLAEIYDLVLDKIIKLMTDYKHRGDWSNDRLNPHAKDTVDYMDSNLYVALFDILSQRLPNNSEKIQTIQNLLDQKGLKICRGPQICEIFYPFVLEEEPNSDD